jgi:hypothetical protein
MPYLVVGVVMAQSMVDMANDGCIALPAIHRHRLVRELKN